MRGRLTAMAALLALAACGGGNANEVTLLNVSYDPTRELYEEFNQAFSAGYTAADGRTVKVNMSHGGSGKQSRAVIEGLEADVVTLALQGDIDIIAGESGKAPADWRSKLPGNSAPYTSTVVFMVRKGNPKGIKDWNDLAAPGVSIVTPNQKTSGGARWNYLAAWAYGARQFGGDETKIRAFVGAIYKNAAKLDSGARGATTTFTQQGTGDVLITWENEAFYTLAELEPGAYELIYPSLSIKAEPPVAVVTGNAEKHGTLQIAEDYLRHLYSPEGQRLAAKHYYRPFDNSAVDPKDLQRFQNIEMVSIDDPLFGGWAQAQPKHFDAGGLFDQIYQPAR
jgi:sulfate transport system substrate-binding protein